MLRNNTHSRNSSKRGNRRSRAPSKAEMRRKTAARRRMLKLGAFFVIPVVALVVAYPYIKAWAEVVKPDLATNCYDLPEQKYTASFIDYSTTNLFSEPHQMLALKTGFNDVFGLMAANQKLDIFTTDKGTTSNLVSPVYTVCKPASTTAQHEALQGQSPNIADKSLAQLTYQSKNASDEFDKSIDQIIVDSQKTKGSLDVWDAPLFRRFKSISRYYKDRNANLDHLIIFSAGIEVSPDLHWCKKQGHLPSWNNFKKRPIYKDIKPFDSFDGLKVTFLMPQVLSAYRSGFGPWCTETEIKDFWTAYFLEAGAREVDIQLLQYRPKAIGAGATSGFEIGLLLASVMRLLSKSETAV